MDFSTFILTQLLPQSLLEYFHPKRNPKPFAVISHVPSAPPQPSPEQPLIYFLFL